MRRALFVTYTTLLLIVALAAHAVTAVIEPRPGSSSSSKGGTKKYGVRPRPGFSGGQTLNNNRIRWCMNPDLPGCQACPDGLRCTACWTQYPNGTGSSFVLNQFTGQCDCPPGYGLWPILPPPTWPGPSHRHLLAQLPAIPMELNPAAAAAAAVAAAAAPPANASDRAGNATGLAAVLAAVNETELAALQGVGAGSWLPDPLPEWAGMCMPCPANYYSAGGQQGFAQCLPCPGDFTTAGATAAANCLFPYCGPGQEPTRRAGRCRACPLGTYSSATANNQPCYTCPNSYTTGGAGSRVWTECRVPICTAGQELDLDMLLCTACKGNSISPGGKRSQGTAQPRCKECPWGTVANSARTVCYTGTCPQPDVFNITCRKDNLLNTTSYFPCGPNGKPAQISQYCTAYPPASVLAFVEFTFIPNEGHLAVSPYLLQFVTQTVIVVRATVSQEIACPAGAYSSNVKYPVVVSFNGRRDCFCLANGPASCWFDSGLTGQQTTASGSAGSQLVNPTINVTIPDPQQDSLEALIFSMAGTNSTRSYTALGGNGYCQRQAATVQVPELAPNGSIVLTNYTNPLQVNCTGPYVTRIAMTPNTVYAWAANGTLPSAALLRGLSQLQMLVCSRCGLDGTLPRDWGTLDSLMELRTLDLSGNTFTGTLPETWGYMVNLQSLTLSSSNTSTMGTIPSAWGYMRSLTFVNLTGLYVDSSYTSCAPWQWANNNTLVWNQTLLPPANYPNMSFCLPP